jgi:hypothetical protein
MRSSRVWMRSIAEWLERLIANAVVTTVLGSIPASSETVESEGRHMKQCRISVHKKRKNTKNPPLENYRHISQTIFLPKLLV